jgi:hypothetical protein
MQNYYKEYERIATKLFEQLKKDYYQLINNARDFDTANNTFNDTSLSPKMGDNGFELTKLGTVHNFSKDWNTRYNLNKSKERPEVFNELISEMTISKREDSVKFLGEQAGLMRMFSLMGEESQKRHVPKSDSQFLEEYDEQYDEIKSTVIWRRENETEFVQLIYALHQAGYLDNEEKRITYLVEQMADALNIKLGAHWQSNFSKSINARKAGYQPKIFDDLKTAFINYREKLINKKERN